jgi:P-type Ca2+ transporter type 2C
MRTNAGEEAGGKPRPHWQDTRKHAEDFSIDQTELNNVLSEQLKQLFNSAIAINSTAFEDHNLDTGELVFVGGKTETALLSFAK